MRVRILNPKEFWPGLIFVAVGLFAFLHAQQYRVGTLGHMGPGYFPIMLGLLLTVIGAIAVGRSLLVESGETVGTWPIGPTLFLMAGVACFGFLIERAGLVIADVVLLVLVCGTRWRDNLASMLVFIAGLTVASIALFVYALKLPIAVF
jgi:hypothetical protein